MSIQPAVQVGRWMYKINEYNLRTIERKKNGRGGRWKPFQICTTEQSARDILFKLQREAEDEE